MKTEVWVAYGDDHDYNSMSEWFDYDSMSQWLIGVYKTEEQAIEAGKKDADRYVKQGGKRLAHHVSIDSTILDLGDLYV